MIKCTGSLDHVRLHRPVGKIIDNALQAVLQHGHVKVHEQPDSPIGNPQIGKQLSLVDRQQLINRFDFQDDLILKNQIKPIPTVQVHILVNDGQRFLFEEV